MTTRRHGFYGLIFEVMWPLRRHGRPTTSLYSVTSS